MEYTIILLAFTVMAMLMPSAYTVAWSKQEHKNELPILYLGLGISFLTVVSALAKSTQGVYVGVALAFILMLYVIFVR